MRVQLWVAVASVVGVSSYFLGVLASRSDSRVDLGSQARAEVSETQDKGDGSSRSPSGTLPPIRVDVAPELIRADDDGEVLVISATAEPQEADWSGDLSISHAIYDVMGNPVGSLDSEDPRPLSEGEKHTKRFSTPASLPDGYYVVETLVAYAEVGEKNPLIHPSRQPFAVADGEVEVVDPEEYAQVVNSIEGLPGKEAQP